MWKLLLVAVFVVSSSGCEKLSKNIDRGQAPADNSQEIKRIDRELSAEQEHSRQQDTTVVEDVRALQQWQNRIKDTAAKDQAFNDAVDKQFAPLYKCLNNVQDANCIVIEDIKNCLKAPAARPNSPLCQAINTLYAQNESQEARLTMVVNCLTNANGFDFSLADRRADWKPGTDDCRALKLIVDTTIKMVKDLDVVIARLTERVVSMERQLAERQISLTKLITAMGDMKDQKKTQDLVIEKISSDAQKVFQNIKSQTKESVLTIGDDTLAKCYFNNATDNGNVSDCVGK